MSDELLLKLDSYHHKITDDAAARIRTQAQRIAELENLLRECWNACSPCASPTPSWYFDLAARVNHALRARR